MSSVPRWEELFDELADLPPSDRDRRLAALAGEDPELAGRLAQLLAADGESTDFFDRPAAELLDDDSLLPAGTRIGSWHLLGLLGRGGMGEVYLAERDEGTFQQQAALKLIKKGMDSRAIVRRFVRERQILSRLDHPGIARLLDGGSTTDGRPFFVLERVEGIPITEYCRRQRLARGLDLEGALRLVQDVCAAVDSAHRRLVVHRDLKPANILVTGDGTVKLLDFGIAKLLAGEEEETAPLTQIDARVMTPAYAAPEQILGEPVTTATDVYALGVLTYELITGTLPHTREHRSLQGLAGELSRQTVERPSAVLRRAPGEEGRRLARRLAGDLDLVVLTALHRDPARRYPSAAAFADDLARALAGRPVRARPDTARYRLRKFVGRNRLAVTAAALGLAALVSGLGLALWQADAARLAARRADAEARRAEQVKAFLLSVFEQSDPDRSRGQNVTARELLASGAQRIDVELAGEPAMQAEMLDAVARSEANLGLTDAAHEHARRALALREAVLPRGDARIAASRVLLGNVTKLRGEMGQARQILERALAETVAARGADSLETAEARRSLANALHRPEDRQLAITLLRQSLATLRRLRGDDDIRTAEILQELGVFLMLIERYEDAEKAYRQALGRLVRALGPRHPRVAIAQAELASLFNRLGHADEARVLLERAIATQRVVYGPRHPNLADTLFRYGVLLLGKQPQAADGPLREALSIYGPDRFEGAHCLRYLGFSAMYQERYEEAAGLFARAADVYAKTLGLEDTQHWRALANLGWAHLKLGRIGLARRELATAVTHIERLTGPESYDLRLPLKQLGETLTQDGAYEEAISAFERVRRMEVKLFPAKHLDVARTHLLLARARIARGAPGDRAAARRSLEDALAVFSDIAHPEDPLYFEILNESQRLGVTPRSP
ncbi:MAG TPA: serine/threonine-protein kinase [Thermoanaerobaculia bacterium]|nr:serine/threonine-protein kinase [Thermoanaerobaculia bacterium]